MIIASAINPQGRMTRVFYRGALKSPVESLVAVECIDYEDKIRELRLRAMFQEGPIFLDAYLQVEMTDVVHLFVRTVKDPEGPMTFACVIAPRSRVRQMIKEGPSYVVEGHFFQVADDRVMAGTGDLVEDHLSDHDVTHAFEAWFNRVFPDLVLPKITYHASIPAIPDPTQFDQWWKTRVVVDREVLGGEEVVQGTRIAIRALGDQAEISSVEDTAEAYPDVTLDDVRFALDYVQRWPVTDPSGPRLVVCTSCGRKVRALLTGHPIRHKSDSRLQGESYDRAREDCEGANVPGEVP